MSTPISQSPFRRSSAGKLYSMFCFCPFSLSSGLGSGLDTAILTEIVLMVISERSDIGISVTAVISCLPPDRLRRWALVLRDWG